jgi:SAM-dependent methyltransferase
MTRERAKWMDQTSFWTLDTAGAPGKSGAAAHGLLRTRQNASVHTIPRVLLGKSVERRRLVLGTKKIRAFLKNGIMALLRPTAFVKRLAKSSPSISAKCDAFHEEESIWSIPRNGGWINAGTDGGLPIPPNSGVFWGGSYQDNESYIHSGRRHVSSMKEILFSSKFCFEKGDKILDFGCAGGRMIRHFRNLSEKCEVWGTDVNQECILWCQQNLSPPFNFFTCTSFPHLPFGDNYFNFIYAGSVFTHMHVLEDAWLLEFKRVLLPGGRLYITIHDRNTLRISRDAVARREPPKFGEEISRYEDSDFAMLVYSSWGYQTGFDSQVFYDADFLCKKWGRVLNVLSVTPEAYGDQTAILLSKD